MNIAVITFEFPPNPGGIGTYAYQVARGLTRFNHKVLVIAAYQSITAEELLDYKNTQDFSLVHFTGYNGRTLSILKHFRFFIRAVNHHSTELTIVISPTAGVIARIMKWIYGIPYVMIGHGSEFLKSNLLHDLLIKFCFDGACHILPNSKFTKKLMDKTRIKNEKYSILYPGADEELFNINYYPRSKKHKKKIILSVGALSIRKGHRYVIDAVDILQQFYSDFEYWIIGVGSEFENLQQQITKKKLQDYVKLLGYVPNETLPDYYQQSDLFIIASNNLDCTQVEGFGIVLLEAHLMKKPVIGSRETGMEEIITEGYNGFLIDPGDPKDIAKKMHAILTDERLSRMMGENGYKIATEKFTWKIFADRLNRLILTYCN